MLRPKFFLLFLGAALIFSGCTKKQETSKVSVGLPAGLQKIEGTLGTSYLEHIVLNVHDGNTLVKEINWDRNCHCAANYNNTPPSYFELDLAPGSSKLIQILLVYQDDTTREMSIKYGGSAVTPESGITKDVSIAVSSTTGGGNGSFGTISGRFYRADGSKPSGLLTAQIKPPVAGRPNMVVMRDDMLAGWFRMFAVDGFEFIYVLEPSKETLFSSVKLMGDALYVEGVQKAAGSHLMHAKVPIHKRRIQYGPNSTVSWSTQEPLNIFVGYFGPGAPSNNVVCYSDPAAEVTSLYLMDQITKLQWKTSYDALHASRVSGGQPSTHATCAATNSATLYTDHIEFKGTFLVGGPERAAGFDGPFKIKAAGDWIESVQATYQSTGTPGVKLAWELLPDVSSVLAGFTIYQKISTGGGGGGGGDDMPCDQRALMQGMTSAGDVTSPTANSHVLAGAVQSSSLDFMICPYITQNSQRLYLLSGVRGHYHANFIATNHFGNGADGDRTISAAISDTSANTLVLGGKLLNANRRVNGVSSDLKTLSAAGTSINTATEFSVGDEIMWLVVAANSTSATSVCGVNDIQTGSYGFSRVVAISGNSMTIDSPLSYDASSATALNTRLSQTTWNSTTDFCLMQVVRVPNFNSLTFTASSIMTLPLFGTLTGLGGVFVMRTHILDVGANSVSIEGNGKGFTGAGVMGCGWGDRGLGAQPSTGNAGCFTSASGGGGGASVGAGGDGDSGAPYNGGAPNLCSGVACDVTMYKKVFLGGGGGGGGATAATGGNGGGIVMVFAKEIRSSTGSLTINSIGIASPASPGPSAGSGGGGGGGGSIFLATKSIASGTTLTVSAKGGNGGTGYSGTGGAGGGGGLAQINSCSALSPTNYVTGGIGDSGTPNGATGALFNVYQSELCNYY